MIDRRLTYLSETIGELLVAQVAHEKENNLLYLNAAAWCNARGLSGNYKYFKKAADDESMHSELIYNHLVESNFDFTVPELKAQPIVLTGTIRFTQLQGLHDQALTREILTTHRLEAICKACLAEDDYITFNAIQPLVIEQREEENKCSTVLDQFEYSKDLIILDDRIESLK
jgi:ferritin